MKKFTLILIITMFALMCACGSSGGDDSAVSTPAASQSTSNESEIAPVPSEEPDAQPEATPEMGENEGESQPEEDGEESLKDIAMGFVGADVSELIAAIGEPESSDYAPSCLGDGEDGNLYYEGFTVYTYRENGVETVEYVE